MLCGKVRQFMADAAASSCDFATSVVSFAEFGVHPERNGRPDLIQDFEDALSDFSFDFLEINLPICPHSLPLESQIHIPQRNGRFSIGYSTSRRLPIFSDQRSSSCCRK